MRLVPTSQPALRLVPVGPSPYTAIIKESEDFNRRSALNATPEMAVANLQRQAAEEERMASRVRVPTGFGGSMELPRAVAEPVLSIGPRVALPVAAGVGLASGVGTIPTIATLAGAGLVGEALGQAAEKEVLGTRKEYSPAEMALNAALTPVTVGPLSGVASPALRAGIRGLEGAALTGIQDIGTRVIRGEEQNLGETFQSAGIGGILGGTIGLSEFGRGRTIGRAQEAGLPTELIPIGRTLREPVLPPPTDIIPAELGAAQQAQAITRAEQGAAAAEGQRYLSAIDESVDQAKVRALAERMMGKTPEEQLQVLDQELRLQKDTLTVAEQRAGLDMKQELQRQIEAQKAMEEAARAEEKAVRDQQRAIADSQKAIEAAQRPPELPKSAQILAEPVTKPPALANVATEIATQTKNSPYALQGKLNEMTGTPAPQAEAVGRPPITTDPAVIKQDRAEYDRLQAEMKRIGYDKTDSPEFQAAWQASEDIKNRHGGMPPPKVDVKAEEGAVFYRGTNPESTERIREPFSAAAGKTFAARTPEGASQYGSSIEEIRAKKGARILRDDTPEFWKVIGRKRPPNGYIGSAGKKGESLVDVVNSAIRKAEADGYDAISIGDADIGTVILNESAFTRKQPTRGPENAIPEQIPNAGVLRPERPELELQAMGEGNVAPEIAAGNQVREGPLQEPLSEAQFLVQQAQGAQPVGGRPAEATRAAAARRAQRGAIPQQVLTPLATSAAGGATGFVSTERQPGETEEEFQARRLRNAAIGAAAGAGVGVAVPALAKGVRVYRAAQKAPLSGRVSPPKTEAGQDIRQTAEKIIENRQYPEKLRTVLAEDPSIVYDKFALTELGDRLAAASDQEVAALRSSTDANERVGATIELANRYSVSGRESEAAALYAEAAKQFTAPAQLINVARLVRSPQAFVRAVNEQLKDVKRVLSKSQEAELTALAAKTIKAEQELARAERAAQEDFSAANESAYRAAQKAAGQAKKAVDDYVHQVSPETFGEIASKIIQGNLLTPLSLVANVFGNMIYQPVRRSATSVATALDAIYAPATGRQRTFARGIPLPARQELEAAADGIKIAAKELLTGPGVDSYIKAEVQRGFKPLRSLAQAFTGKNLAVREDGSVALTDRAKKFIEGTLGIAPEVMFRFLNLGDKPFRRAAEMEILLEQARLKKLKGRDLEKFLEFPDKATQTLIETEGRRAIFAQENKGVTQLNQFLDSGVAKIIGADQIPALRDAIKIFNRVIVPFRQFPVNYVMTALNFAAPELASAKAIYYAQKGDRRKALQNIGEGALGMMMYGGAAYLWDKGIISEPTDKDAKQRTVQYEQMGPQRINVTGLQRALDGGDGSYRLGDTTMDWGRLGIPASVFYVFTRNAAKGKKDYARLGEQPPSNYATERLGAIPGMAAFALDQSFLSGTSSFLEAMKNPDPEGQELQNWVRNAFRAVTSIAVPNSVEALARAQYEYIPDLKGDSLTDTLKNTWDYKVMQLPEGDRAILKRDVWGDPVRRNPEDKNPYLNQFIDVTRSETKRADPFKQRLIDLYKETGTPDVYPTIPLRNMTLEGITVKLTPQDYEDYQEIVGKLRRQYAERIINDPRFNAPTTIPEQKIMALKAAYEEGAKAGKQAFLARPGVALRYFPELLGKPVPPPEESRVISRDPAARGRLRLQPSN